MLLLPAKDEFVFFPRQSVKEPAAKIKIALCVSACEFIYFNYRCLLLTHTTGAFPHTENQYVNIIFLFHREPAYLYVSKKSKIRCYVHPNEDCATTADSPGCKLGKAITAASAGSRLTRGDRMNNLHIPCVASVCGQISIWKKIQHLDKRSDRYLRFTPRVLLVYTQVITPSLARADSSFYLHSK